MPFTFRMILSGLMAVIPDRTFDTSLESADSVTILVPNLLKPRPLNNRRNGQQEILDPHFPILDFDLQNRQASSTRPVDLSTNDGRGICHLETEKIEILPLPGLTPISSCSPACQTMSTTRHPAKEVSVLARHHGTGLPRQRSPRARPRRGPPEPEGADHHAGEARTGHARDARAERKFLPDRAPRPEPPGPESGSQPGSSSSRTCRYTWHSP